MVKLGLVIESAGASSELPRRGTAGVELPCKSNSTTVSPAVAHTENQCMSSHLAGGGLMARSPIGKRGWNLTGEQKPVVRGEQHYAWKGDAAQEQEGRQRARALYKALGQCRRCDAPAVDRHHNDGNTRNNSPENVIPLCRRCHMQADGRLDQLTAHSKNRQPKPPEPCLECARPYKPLRNGRCASCDNRARTARNRQQPANRGA